MVKPREAVVKTSYINETLLAAIYDIVQGYIEGNLIWRYKAL